ncbi:MAG: hypothetical protein PF483_04320 [Halothiobacillus sp.]|jgi:hypothetical protein|nr:hypothetical protein [Halothiobacillus sp.]
MDRYLNLGRNSNVVAYKSGAASILVEINDGSIYRYTSLSAGPENLAELKWQTGQGRNSYINRYVRKGYAEKMR